MANNSTEALIDEELARIGECLRAGPDPFEHAGLYAAQQALCWARNPEGFKSPFATVRGIDSSGHLADPA